MTDEQIAFSIDQAPRSSGSSIPAKRKARHRRHDRCPHQDFYDKMVKAKVTPEGIDISKSYTLAFINKGVGLDLKK